MIVSPASNRRASSSRSIPWARQLGTITHAARGVRSFAANASSESEPVAPSPASCLTLLRIPVEDDALMPAPHQPSDHVRTHAAQADHSELHGSRSFRERCPEETLPPVRWNRDRYVL